MKMKKRIPRKYIDLGTFEQLFKEFLSIPTWTKRKYAARDTFYDYLESKMVTSIRIKRYSKYNYCTYTHSFTILRVPLAVKGKLYPLRGELVLIRCSSRAGAWTQYINEVYLLKEDLKDADHSRLQRLFGEYYIKRYRL
jgi:hypothetical protein